METRFRALALAAALSAAINTAHAHDTWFAPLPHSAGSGLMLALGTGNQFPVQESGIEHKHLVYSGCRREPGGKPLALQRMADAPTALELRVRAERRQALTCWAQTASFEVELPDDKIALYFKEIQAPPAVRDAWAQMRARGVKWKERYTKHARIELNLGAGARTLESGASARTPEPGASAGTLAPGASAGVPVNMAMDVLLEAPQRTPRRGDTLQFRVLRDGRPLPDFAVELRGDKLPIGVWRKTDAEGRVRVPAPLAGRWVLRGTDLRPSEREPDTWESRFVTLAFEVAAEDKPRNQADSSDNPNARSTSQMPAKPAISTEPPAITARR
jgi:hypothetical protein